MAKRAPTSRAATVAAPDPTTYEDLKKMQLIQLRAYAKSLDGFEPGLRKADALIRSICKYKRIPHPLDPPPPAPSSPPAAHRSAAPEAESIGAVTTAGGPVRSPRRSPASMAPYPQGRRNPLDTRRRARREPSPEITPATINAPSPESSPEPMDVSVRDERASEESLRQTVDMLRAFRERNDDLARQCAEAVKGANAIRAIADDLKKALAAEKGRRERIEAVLVYWRQEDAVWDHEAVFPPVDAFLRKINKEEIETWDEVDAVDEDEDAEIKEYREAVQAEGREQTASGEISENNGSVNGLREHGQSELDAEYNIAMEKAKAGYRARRENEQAITSSSGPKETDGSSDTEESGSLHQLESRAFAPETSLESPAPLSRRVFSGPVQMQRLPLKRLPSRVGIFQKKAPKRGRYDAASSTLARYASHARPGDAPDDPPDLWKGIAFTGDVLEDLNLSSPRRRELTPSTTTTEEELAGRLSPTQSFLDFPPDAPNVSSESASLEKAAAQDRPEDAGSPTPRSAFTWWGRPRNVPQRSSSRAANGKKRSEPAGKATTPDAGSPKPSALNLAVLEPKTPQPGERATDPGLRVGVDQAKLGVNMSNESELQQ